MRLSRRTRLATARWSRTGGAALALVVAGLVGSTGVAGAHGGDTTKIHSCIVPSSGYAQIVGANDTCSKNYKPLDWAAVDTNTTYGAGSGLSLSSANVFSVTDAPWSGLTGIPAGFADGVDNVGSTAWSDLTGVPGGFLDNVDNVGDDWDELTDVPSGFADEVDDVGDQWDELDGVPLELLDGDDDGSAGLAQLVSQLESGDGTPNEAGDPVSFTKIKHLDSPAGGRILGSFIQDGTIQSQDIADGAIQGADLGSVVTVATDTLDPSSIPAASRVAVTIPIAGVKINDLVTVSPPALLEEQLLFVGSDVLLDGEVTVYLYNTSGAAIDGAPHTWTVRYLNTSV